MFRKLTATILSSTVGVCSALSVMICDERTLLPAIAGSIDFDSPEQSEPFESSGSASGASPAPRLPAVQKAESRSSGYDSPSSVASSSQKSDAGLRGALDSEIEEDDPPIKSVAPPVRTAPARVAVQNSVPAKKTTPAVAVPASNNRTTATSRSSGEEPSGGMLSRIAGTIVGVPKSMYRSSVKEFHEGLKDMTNDSTNPCLVIPAAMITAPFSVAAGCVEATASALHRGGGKADQSTAAKSEHRKVATKK